MNLTKLGSPAQHEKITVVFWRLSPKLESSLEAGGVLQGNDDPLCRVSPNIERTIKWCEEPLLAYLANRNRVARRAKAWLEAELGRAWVARALNAHFQRIELQPGTLVFNRGADRDSPYLHSSGRVAVI